MLNTAILLDKKNDWIKPYLLKYLKKSKILDAKIFYNYADIKSYELVFILGYTTLLPKSINKQNKLVLIVHESDLPNGRGFAPIQWQILEGKKKITFSLIDLKEEVDSGDVYDQLNVTFNGNELFDEIREKQAFGTFNLIKKFIKKYPSFKKKPQKGKVSFYRRRNKNDSKLNVYSSLKDQFNKLRIGNNDEWPSFFVMNGVKYILKIYKDE